MKTREEHRLCVCQPEGLTSRLDQVGDEDVGVGGEAFLRAPAHELAEVDRNRPLARLSSSKA